MLQTDIEKAIKLLESKVSAFKGDFTLADASAVSGLSVDEAKSALDAMMAKYDCRLRLTENGDLIYGFGASLRRRGAKTWKDYVAAIGQIFWKIFTWFYKAWIAITLVVYFGIFLVLLIAMVVAAVAASKDSKRSPVNLGKIFDVFFSIFRWRTITGDIGYKVDNRGYRYKNYTPRPSPLNENKKSFMASVYDFVFGPERVQIDPLANAREVAAYLRREKGIITPAELIALAGWTREKAESFLSDCIVRFQGEILFTDNGVIYGRFDQITRKKESAQDGAIEYYWDEYEPDYELTGNTTGRNALISFMNIFNLAFSVLILKTYYRPLEDMPWMNESPWIGVFLGWVPFVFSLIFFIIPLFRSFAIIKQKRNRRAMNVRKRIMRYLFSMPSASATVDEVVTYINGKSKGEEVLKKHDVQEALDSMLRDFNGETTLNNNGDVRYTFPQIEQELKESELLRKNRSIDNDLGAVIVDTQNTQS